MSRCLRTNATGSPTRGTGRHVNSHVDKAAEFARNPMLGIDKIKEAIEASMTEGAQTFEQSLFRLYKDGLISLEEALHNADSPTNLYWLINHDNSKPEDSKPEDGESFAGFTLSH